MSFNIVPRKLLRLALPHANGQKRKKRHPAWSKNQKPSETRSGNVLLRNKSKRIPAILQSLLETAREISPLLTSNLYVLASQTRKDFHYSFPERPLRMSERK